MAPNPGCSPCGRLVAACAEPGPAGRNLHTLRFRHGRLRRGVEGRASSRRPEFAATTKRGPPPPHGSPRRRGGTRFIAGCHAHAAVGMSMSFPSAAGTCSRQRPREHAYRRQAWHRTMDVPRAGGSWRRVQNPAPRAGTCTPYGSAAEGCAASWRDALRRVRVPCSCGCWHEHVFPVGGRDMLTQTAA